MKANLLESPKQTQTSSKTEPGKLDMSKLALFQQKSEVKTSSKTEPGKLDMSKFTAFQQKSEVETSSKAEPGKLDQPQFTAFQQGYKVKTLQFEKALQTTNKPQFATFQEETQAEQSYIHSTTSTGQVITMYYNDNPSLVQQDIVESEVIGQHNE